MTGKTKKKKRRMESDGRVGEKTANTHRERLTLMCRGEDQRRTACRMICVGPRLRGDTVTLQAFMPDFKLLLTADCVADCSCCMNCCL